MLLRKRKLKSNEDNFEKALGQRKHMGNGRGNQKAESGDSFTATHSSAYFCLFDGSDGKLAA